MARLGRRAVDLSVDTRPGKVLALAMLANVPIFVGFVLTPLFADGAAARAFTPLVVWVTPAFALLSLFVFVRAGPVARAHRASRMGLVLDVVALLLWALVVAGTRAGGAGGA